MATSLNSYGNTSERSPAHRSGLFTFAPEELYTCLVVSLLLTSVQTGSQSSHLPVQRFVLGKAERHTCRPTHLAPPRFATWLLCHGADTNYEDSSGTITLEYTLTGVFAFGSWIVEDSDEECRPGMKTVCELCCTFEAMGSHAKKAVWFQWYRY